MKFTTPATVKNKYGIDLRETVESMRGTYASAASEFDGRPRISYNGVHALEAGCNFFISSNNALQRLEFRLH